MKEELEYDYLKVLHWSVQLAEALNYCHTEEPKIIHRDIKPSKLAY